MLENEFICQKCGGKLKKRVTDFGDEYECVACHAKMYNRKNAPGYAEYVTSRRILESNIERKIDIPFSINRCKCGCKKMIRESTLLNGITYTCSKCGKKYFDENVKQCLDDLYELKNRYPDDASKDAIYNFLMIRVFTYNFKIWDEQVNYFSKQLEKSVCDIDDFNLFKIYQNLLETLAKKSKKEIYYSSQSYIDKCNIDDIKKKKKSKKFRKVLLTLFSVLLVCFIVIYFTKAEIIFGFSKIRLYNDLSSSTYVEQNTIFSKKYSIDVPQKEGHTFLGYYDKAGNKYIDENGKSIEVCKWFNNQVKELYANWVVNKYTISYTGVGAENLSSEIAEYNTLIKVPKINIPEAGEFLGWLYNDHLIKEDDLFVVPAYDVTFVASWNYKTYKVDFESNGGNKIETKYVKYNDNLEFDAPTKKYNTFMGWYLDENFEQFFDGKNYKLSSDIKLYAKWSVNSYTITYNDPKINKNQSVFSYKYGEKVSFPFFEDDNDFIGWLYNDDLIMKNDSFTMPGENIELKAVWKNSDLIKQMVSTEGLYCKMDNGYNYNETDANKTNNDYIHNFEFGKFVITNSLKTNTQNTFKMVDGTESKLSFKILYDTNNLPLGGRMTSRSVNEDSWNNNFYKLPYDIGTVKVGFGLLVAKIEYNDSTVDKICMNDVFKNKLENTEIIIKDKIEKPCKITISICYELKMWAPGLVIPISGAYYANYRINQEIIIQ